MRIAQALAGFSLGQADVLRKAMGKKDPKVMAKQRDAFMEGARAQKVNEKKAAKIFELMEYFAGYGFNKSHSTAYAFLAYQTAYLKANYPWHFAAALLTIEAQNTDKLAIYLAECRERGVPVLAPDINTSLWHFSVEKGRGVRFGLDGDQGPGRGRRPGARRRARGRSAAGSRRCTRCARSSTCGLANKRVFEALVKSGACDSLLPPSNAAGLRALRRAALRLDRAAMRARQPDAAGQGSGPGGSVRWRRRAAAARPVSRCRTCRPGPRSSSSTSRRSRSGCTGAATRSIATRPTSPRSARRRPPTCCRSARRPRRRPTTPEDGAAATPRNRAGDGRRQRRRSVAEDVSIGGIVGGLRPLKTRKGDRMCVFMLDDPHGSIEVVVFPEAFKQFGHLADTGRMVVVKGRFERDDESARILAAEISPIELVSERLATSVAIRLSTPPHGRATFEQLWDVLRPAQGRPPRGVRHRAAPARQAAARARGRQRADPRPAVGPPGVGRGEDLRRRIGRAGPRRGARAALTPPKATGVKPVCQILSAPVRD